jgi:hypothetical protein
MYWDDFAAYEEDGRLLQNVRRVGWLAEAHPFRKGGVSQEFVEALRKLAVHGRVNQMRGFHYCELCDQEDVLVTDQGVKALLGSAEIWVPADGDTTYAAPDLVLHYVQAHGYEPPAEFVAAVLGVDLGTFDAEALWREQMSVE